MKKISIILAFLISLSVFSQEENIFSTEFNDLALQCENIGRTLTNKSKKTIPTEWYDGRYKEIIETNIKQLESDIDNSTVEVMYNLTKIKESPVLLYRLQFFNKVTKEAFGQLFIHFRNKENNLVDFVTFISKEKMKIVNLDINENSSFLNASQVKKN